jgi:class 3 adenylate cyclase
MINKKLYLFFALLCFISGVVAQNPPKNNERQPTIDDLRRGYESAVDDSLKASYLYKLSSRYFAQNDFKTALDYAQKSLTLYEKIKLQKGIAESFIQIGYCYAGLKKHKIASNYIEKGLKIADENNDKGLIISSYLKLKTLAFESHHYKKAYIYYDSFSRKTLALLSFNYALATQEEKDKYDNLLLNDKLDKESAIQSLRSRHEEELNREIKVRTLIHDKKMDSIGREYDKRIAAAKTTELKQLAQKDKALALEREKRRSELDLQSVKAEASKKFALDSTENIRVMELTAAKADQDKAVAVAIVKEKLKKRNVMIYGFAGAFLLMLLSTAIFFGQRNKIRQGKKESDALLLNILPAEVAEELKKKGSADAKKFEAVTVLFTDFKDFTQISEKMTPEELVSELNTFFKSFDAITSALNIEKIKTIGDSYMCVAGLPMVSETHAEDAIKAGLEIQKFVDAHSKERIALGKEPLQIRIGIHSGPAVAGIVGSKKYAYDIWGDTVNTASRMESSGEPGKVNISDTTYNLIKDKFKCVARGKIEAKHKGMIEMYFVEGLV